MRLRTLFTAFAICMGLSVPGHAQLARSLGFDVACEGAVKPSCNTLPTTVNTGSCYIYVCHDNAPVGDDGELCPVYGECLANEARLVTTDTNGCAKVTCTLNTGCVTIDMVQCPASQHAVETTLKDDAGCPVFSCEFPPSHQPEETCDKPLVDGICPPADQCDAAPVCEQGTAVSSGKDGNGCDIFTCESKLCEEPIVCPTGHVPVSDGTNDAGCETFRCEQKVCPQVATCPTGFLASMTVGDDGCKNVKCTKNDKIEAKSCPVQANCPTGYKRVNGEKTASGCPTFTCEKTTATDKDTDDKGKDDKVDLTKPLIVEGECRGSMNKACESKVQCPAGLLAYHIKGACNTRWGSVTDAELERVPMGSLAVVKPSSQPAGSSCKIAQNDIQSGSDRMNRDHIIQDPTKPIKFSCRDIDKNGGECHIRVAVQCMPPMQYWTNTRD